MDMRPANVKAVLPVFLTREEAYLLMEALLNPALDLGEHEPSLCAKVRDAWDALRPVSAEPEAECA